MAIQRQRNTPQATVYTAKNLNIGSRVESARTFHRNQILQESTT